MGFGVWPVGTANRPYPQISLFRRKRRESDRCFRKVSDIVNAVSIPAERIFLETGIGYN